MALGCHVDLKYSTIVIYMKSKSDCIVLYLLMHVPAWPYLTWNRLRRDLFLFGNLFGPYFLMS